MFFLSLGYGQVIGNGDGITTDVQVGIVYREVPIEGSAYINDIYKNGKIYINGVVRSEALMRFDAVNEAIEILNENGKPRKLFRQNNIKVTFDNLIYEVDEYMEGEKTKMAYFNTLNSGDVKLLFRPKKVFLQAENPDNGYDSFSPPKYEDVSSYYLKFGNNPAECINLSKRAIIKALGQYEKTLKDYISTQELNLRNQKDAIQLIQFFNTLKSDLKPEL
ncbi:MULTISPECIES: hypothetical protein [Maribacter]|nr:hypothetical protein [Maribacter sp. PR66]